MLEILALAALAAPPADTVKITEFPVPYENSRPRDPYVDPTADRVWFVGQRAECNCVAYLDLATKEFKRYDLDDRTLPHNLIVDRNGIVWYAGNAAEHIGRLDPATGNITKYPTPGARDPHTLIFGASNDIWFTAQQAAQVGHFDKATGRVHLIPTGQGTRPYGIVTAEDGQPWFVLFGTNKIGTVIPSTMELKTFDLPEERTRPRRLARTTDGMIFYGDYSRGYLGRLDPGTGAVKEWALPSGERSLPYAMTVDEWDRIWLVETGVQPNMMVGFDPRTEQFFSGTPILPSGGGTVRHMMYHAPSKSIWFGTDTNNLGQAVLTPPQRAMP